MLLGNSWGGRLNPSPERHIDARTRTYTFLQGFQLPNSAQQLPENVALPHQRKDRPSAVCDPCQQDLMGTVGGGGEVARAAAECVKC